MDNKVHGQKEDKMEKGLQFEATAQSGAVTSSGSANYFVGPDGRHLRVAIVGHGPGKWSYGTVCGDSETTPVVYGVDIHWHIRDQWTLKVTRFEVDHRFGIEIPLSQVPVTVLEFAAGASNGASCYHCHCLQSHIGSGEAQVGQGHSWDVSPSVDECHEEALKE